MFLVSDIQPIQRVKLFFELLRGGALRQPWFQLFLCLCIMGTHWVVLESWGGVSPVKIGYMALCGLLLLGMRKRANQTVLMLSGLYYGCVLLSAYVFSDGVFTFRSIAYMLLFLVTYCYYISLLYSKAVTYELAVRFLRGMLLAYFFFILLQQLTAAIHLPISLLNCHGYIWGWKFPGMNIEPSHCARVFASVFLVFVEMLHLRIPQARSFQYLWKNERPALCAFIYSMCTMGSGMGMASLMLVILYLLFFTKRTWFVVGCVVFAAIIYLIRDTEAFSRFWETLQATATLDEETITHADTSAAARVNVILGTGRNINLSDSGFWFGYGRESGINMSGILVIYGAIAFGAQLLLLSRFVFRRLFSLEVLIFVVFTGMAVGNVAYVWAIMMYWSMLKYFTIEEGKHVRSSATSLTTSQKTTTIST